MYIILKNTEKHVKMMIFIIFSLKSYKYLINTKFYNTEFNIYNRDHILHFSIKYILNQIID